MIENHLKLDFLHNKILLPLDQIPKNWLNIAPFLPEKPLPALLPNGVPADKETMEQIFPSELVKQAMSQEEFIPIPQEIRETLALCNRPTPILRAFRLEKALGVDSSKIKIFCKMEYVSPAGSHKLNTAIVQAYYAKKDGLEGLTTETGAGQWGTALSMAGKMLGLKVKVFQVRGSYNDKPSRRVFMKNYGGEVHPSPSDQTKVGRRFLEGNPNHPGSLGIAISEAIELSMTNPRYRYSLGSVLDFVCLHQTVIGQEAKKQMEIAGEYPDVIIGCIGGGSNFAGLALPFMKDKLTGNHTNTEFIGAEPTACPSMTKGKYAWDFGDTGKMAPIIKMYTLGNSFIPAPVHAGGLRYHGSSPILSILKKHNYMKTEMFHQTKAIKAGVLFSQTEGILPAVETCHAIACAIDKAREAQNSGKTCTILLNFSGHGYFDTHAYKALQEGSLVDYEYPESEIQKSLGSLPNIGNPSF
ncbi:MAG: TrpB-like pyridoxal phosphate-dependent enzyme [Promethearchaeota archaeon]